MSPRRIQMSRQYPWRPEHPDAVIVARPSKWGNPWHIGDGYTRTTAQAITHEHYTAEDVVSLYETDLRAGLLTFTDEDVRRELAGHDLACWCPLDQPCHADVLLELANGSQP